MKKYILLSIVLILSAQLLAGCSCEHEWNEATCNQPMTCSLCGASEGEPLAHIWTEATCTASRTCTLCAATEGDPLGHSWTDASCTAPKICALCAAQDGDPLPHTPGETEISADYVRAVQIETQACTACGSVLSTNETTISLVDGDYFLLSPEEFVERLNYIYTQNGMTDWSAKLELVTSDGQDYNQVELRCDDIIYAHIFIASKSKDITAQEKDERIISMFFINIFFGKIVTQQNGWTIEEYQNADAKALVTQMSELLYNEDLFADILMPIIQVCSSSMSEADADTFARNAHISTCNPFGMEKIRYQAQCGDCYIGVNNLFLANLSYAIGINTTSDFWFSQ